MSWRGVIRQYPDFLPVKDDSAVVTIPEGGTPLIRADRIAAMVGRGVIVFLKYEGLNPTGSFKDRGMTYAITKAVEQKSKAVICASTGNTSASAAAYAARAGLRAYVLIPEGKIALGKLSQAMVHGAKVVQIEGNFDDALTIVKQLSVDYPVTLVNSLNPYRIEGQKSAAFEIVDDLGASPDYHFLPVGNAGNITAYWKGYREYKLAGMMDRLPVMMGFQASGSAPIVRGEPVLHPETVATAIRIGNPASWQKAEAARDESGGEIGEVTDEQILDAYRLLAGREGVFCEPASAASVAGLLKKAGSGFFDDKQGATIVCTLTGHGLKDPDNAIKISEKPSTLPADIKPIAKILGF